ncbi:MAG: hypothetical protein LAT75_04240 [Candidatus Cyclonatronum sp.]|uniref:hypothetical protein n=1 Tax=Cyclonatronum sp. TaxID=3024185 RepID=UPI0025C4184B|nr:hypothetical protein [Cyclonatronum sp.]MCC5932665.1 hypothetical protein [Balneolales bacterium]MCH8486049.1 hypothetical protein [Cyclonatronum sp.]
MRSEKLLLDLEDILEQLGYVVRKERGSFRGGFCLLEGEKIIMLNKNQPPDYLVGVIARFLLENSHEIELDSLYIKPATRKHLNERIRAARHLSERRSEDRPDPLNTDFA